MPPCPRLFKAVQKRLMGPGSGRHGLCASIYCMDRRCLPDNENGECGLDRDLVLWLLQEARDPRNRQPAVGHLEAYLHQATASCQSIVSLIQEFVEFILGTHTLDHRCHKGAMPLENLSNSRIMAASGSIFRGPAPCCAAASYAGRMVATPQTCGLWMP